MKQEDNKPLTALSANNPVTKRNIKGAGRKPKSFFAAPVQEIINLTAPMAARILQAHIERRRGYKHLAWSLQRACEYVIDHAIGKARQKIEHSGGILAYGELAKSAEKLDKKPRDILADVEELANKYQVKEESSHS